MSCSFPFVAATAIFRITSFTQPAPRSAVKPSEVSVAERANISAEPTPRVSAEVAIRFVKSRICHSVAAILLPNATTTEPILSIFPTPSPVTVPILASNVAASSADIPSTATHSFATVSVNFPICSIGTQSEPPTAAIEDNCTNVTGISLLIFINSCLNAASCSGVPSTVLLTQVKASSKDLAISEAFFNQIAIHPTAAQVIPNAAQVVPAAALIQPKEDTTAQAAGLTPAKIPVSFPQVFETPSNNRESAE